MKKAILTTIVLLSGIFAFGQTAITTYTDQGNVAKTFYMSGELTERVTYFETGSIQEVATFKNSLPEGEWITYDANGKVLKKCNFKDGKKTGNWLVWSDDADAFYTITYLNNKRINVATSVAEN